SAPRKPRAGARIRRKSRARPDHGWRAARDRAAHRPYARRPSLVGAPPPSPPPAAHRPPGSPRVRERQAAARRRGVEPGPASAISARQRLQARPAHRYPLGLQSLRRNTTRAVHKCNAATRSSTALPAVYASHAALLNSRGSLPPLPALLVLARPPRAARPRN